MAAAGLGRDRSPFELDRVQALESGGAWRTVFADGRAAGPAALAPCLPPADLQGTRAVLAGWTVDPGR